MPPYLTPLQIFENYKKANPQKCKGKSTTEICRLAGLSNKQIAELKTTSAWLFCFDKENTSRNQDFSITEIFGGNFKKSKNTADTKKEVPRTHRFTSLVEVDSNGIIFPQQFTQENIKKKYNQNDYKIIEKKENKNGNTYITTSIINKKTNKKEIEYFNDRNVYVTISTFNEDSTPREKVNLCLTGKDNRCYITDKTTYSQNTAIYTDYEYASEDVKEVRKMTKKGNLYQVTESTIYHNNKPYITQRGNDFENHIVNYLKEIFTDDSPYNDIDLFKFTNFIQNIDSGVIRSTLMFYEKETGRNLLEDIDKKIDKNLNFTSKIGSFRLKQQLYSIDKRYSERAINNFNCIEEYKYSEDTKQGVMSDVIRDISDLIFFESPDNIKLLKNKKVINEIISFCENLDYADDIKDELRKNINNPSILLINIKRLHERNESYAVLKYSSKKVAKTTNINGKIDGSFEQGKTGDCWLLAGVISLLAKKSSINVLNSLLTFDKNSNSVIVHLKGVNKSYTITNEEIQNAKHLSNGDGDIRAIELAVDKYLYELACTNSKYSLKSDINGNDIDTVYKILFGDNVKHIKSYEEVIKEDFNDANKVFCIGSDDNNVDIKMIENALINSKGQPVDFITGHAYAIKGSDNQYVYLINPWDSKETLKITHKRLKMLNCDYGMCNLK